MRALKTTACGFALLGASYSAIAADFDGAAPLLCAVTDTVSCDDQGHCVEGPANAVNLPTFISIDTQKKTAKSTRDGGEKRTSQILSVHKEAGALIIWT